MKLKENKDVQKFLQSILEQVKFKQAHQEIELEYLNHIEDSVRVGMSYGLDPEAAVQDAVRRMGAPNDIGHRLNQVHKPKTDIVIVLSALALCLLGIYSLSSLGFATSQTVWTFLGLLVGAGMIFIKPGQLMKASPYLYIGTFFLLAVSHFSGIEYLGQPYLSVGPLKIKMVDVSVVLFLISVAGLLFKIQPLPKSRAPLSIILPLLPLLYFAAVGSVFPGFLYFVATMAIFLTARLSWLSVAAFTSVGILALAGATQKGTFLTPENYASLQATEAHTDFIFFHMLSSTPTLAFMAILAFGLLIVRLATFGQEIKNRFSSALYNSSLTMIAFGVLWGLASGLGYVPMPQTGVNLPFLSYGGSLMVLHLALIGLLLGAIRRRTLHLI